MVTTSPLWTILCDFDGTISFNDVTDTLLETFGKSGWRTLEERWLQGAIGSRECMSGQVALIDAAKEELDACLRTLPVDPFFSKFCRLAKSLSIPLIIVSDGIDYAIKQILQANGIHGLPVIANHLRQVGERQWALDSPWYQESCLSASGTCKCAVARSQGGQVLMIGDGRSDFCVSRIASHVFAKNGLIEECQRQLLPYTAITDFSCAIDELPRLVQSSGSRSLSAESVGSFVELL
ncbi:MAG: MtnX-like HAD-IB family phosphatase [Enterobacteriaceae bacterium]